MGAGSLDYYNAQNTRYRRSDRPSGRKRSLIFSLILISLGIFLRSLPYWVPSADLFLTLELIPFEILIFGHAVLFLYAFHTHKT
jgi:hypothetical protein